MKLDLLDSLYYPNKTFTKVLDASKVIQYLKKPLVSFGLQVALMIKV